MNVNLTDEQKKYLMIAGVVAGSIALLTYPAILLYRKLKSRRNEQTEDSNVKSFAPSYRGSHKPHHRKAETNGHVQHANA
jgi:hypothetical protein